MKNTTMLKIALCCLAYLLAVPSIAYATNYVAKVEVLSVEPITKNLTYYDKSLTCTTIEVKNSTESKFGNDQKSIAIGAVVGGGAGVVVTAATKVPNILGAISGIVVGNYVGKKYGNGREYYQENLQTICEEVFSPIPLTASIGYIVTYEFNGKEYQSLEQNHPGEKLLVAIEFQ